MIRLPLAQCADDLPAHPVDGLVDSCRPVVAHAAPVRPDHGDQYVTIAYFIGKTVAEIVAESQAVVAKRRAEMRDLVEASEPFLDPADRVVTVRSSIADEHPRHVRDALPGGPLLDERGETLTSLRPAVRPNARRDQSERKHPQHHGNREQPIVERTDEFARSSVSTNTFSPSRR